MSTSKPSASELPAYNALCHHYYEIMNGLGDYTGMQRANADAEYYGGYNCPLWAPQGGSSSSSSSGSKNKSTKSTKSKKPEKIIKTTDDGSDSRSKSTYVIIGVVGIAALGAFWYFRK